MRMTRRRLDSMNNLAMAYHDAGRLDLAIPILATTLEKRRMTLGDDHADTIETMNDLAVAYWQAGQADQGDSTLRVDARESAGHAGRRPQRHAHDHGQPGRGLRRPPVLHEKAIAHHEAIDRSIQVQAWRRPSHDARRDEQPGASLPAGRARATIRSSFTKRLWPNYGPS